MTDPAGTLLAFVQILLLAITAIGWGWWVEKLAGGKLRAGLADQALCALAGWAACTMLLQDLVYLGVRVTWSAWLGLGVAIAGWITFLVRHPRDDWRARLAAAVPTGAVALVVILFQGTGLWHHGAHSYYGNAHQDQVNYVQIAQFFIEEPFDRDVKDMGLHPWMVKGIDSKVTRIGQSMAHAYAAVVSFSDAKSAYGAVSIFSLGLMAAAVFGLLRNLGLSVLGAALAAIWAGVLPTVTKMHLDGFFSQAFVLYTLPALAGVALIASRHGRLAWLSGSLILGQLLTGYTEIFVVGAALTFVALLGNLKLSFGRRLALFGGIVSVALLLVPAYPVRVVTFLRSQYGVASNVEILGGLFPRSGTWGGWSELFFPSGVSMAQPVPQLVVLAGFLVVGLALAGLVSTQPARRLWLSLLAGVPAGICAVLLSLPAFPKYPFAKLLATFSPLFVALASLGIWRSLPLLVVMVRRHPNPSRITRSRWVRAACYLVACTFVVASGWASARMLGEVVRNEGILSLVNSPQMRVLYEQLETNPERIYLLNEQHNILNAWLAYHARHAQVYADVDYIGDRPTASSEFAFRRPPPTSDLPLLNGTGIKSFRLTRGAPDILVRNPQGIEGSWGSLFYWIGDSAIIEFYDFGQEEEDFVFSLQGFAGPANPSPHREVALIPAESGGKLLNRSFDGEGRLLFPIRLKPGRNTFTFQVIAPTEWLVRVPGDPRKLMVHIQKLGIVRREVNE